ncbi:hypothetical protein ES703_31832 [subsurface metagenome]
MYFKCDHCDKYFTTQSKLQKHIKRVHQSAGPASPAKSGSSVENPAPQPKPAATPGQFEVKKPEPKKKESQPQQGYFCQTCGHEPIEKGTPNCPSCGEPLNWEGVQ